MRNGRDNGVTRWLTKVFVHRGTPIVGQILGTSSEGLKWWAGATFSAVVMLVGAALMLISRSMMVRRKGTQFL